MDRPGLSGLKVRPFRGVLTTARFPLRLDCHTRERITPIGPTGLRQGTSLESVGCARSQTGNRDRFSDGERRLARPCARSTAERYRRPAQFVAARAQQSHQDDQQLAADGARFDQGGPHGRRAHQQERAARRHGPVPTAGRQPDRRRGPAMNHEIQRRAWGVSPLIPSPFLP